MSRLWGAVVLPVFVAAAAQGTSREIERLRELVVAREREVATLERAIAHLSAVDGPAAPPPRPVPQVSEAAPSPPQQTPAPQLLDRLGGLRDRAEKVRENLRAYWGGNDSVLLHTAHLVPGMQQYKDGLDFIALKVGRALVYEQSFTIAVVGDSVAAGHDNCQYDSYTAQLTRLLKPVFEASGAGLTVRSAGQGGHCHDSQPNQIWCLRHMVGDDVDVIQASWTFTDLGLSEKFSKYRAPTPALSAWREMLVRWALMMPRSPAVNMLWVGDPPGLLSRDLCKYVAGDDAWWAQYARFGFNNFCLLVGMQHSGLQWDHTTMSVGDGLHDTTLEGEALPKDSPRRKALGILYRNWHPGPLGFQVLAHSYAYYLLAAVVLAVDMLRAHIRKNRPLEQIYKKDPKGTAPRKLPVELHCPPEYCSNPAGLPGCNYFSIPHYGEPQVQVMGGDADPNSGWQLLVPPPSPFVPREDRDRPECEHLDYCAAMTPRQGGSSPLTLVLPAAPNGLVFVCCNGRGCVRHVGPTSAVFTLDGEQLDPWRLGPVGEAGEPAEPPRPWPWASLQPRCGTAAEDTACNGRLVWPSQKCVVVRNGTALPAGARLGIRYTGRIAWQVTHVVAF